VYVHVGGGAACLISLIYWAVVLLEFVVCTAMVDLTVRTLFDSVGNVIYYFMYHNLLKLWCIVVKFFTGIKAVYRLPNLECIYPTDGPWIYPVVFWHYTVVVCCVLFLTVCSCFLLCTAFVHHKMFVTLLIDFLVHFVTPIR